MPNLQASLITASVFLVAVGLTAVTRTEEIPRRAPYNAVRWDESSPSVRIGDQWASLVSIDGVPTAEIVDFCKRTYGEKWLKRFEEDLVEVLIGMGHEPSETVRLVVRDTDSTETRTIERVPMTLANRQAIWHAARARRAQRPANREFPKLAPYAAIRWEDGDPDVRVGDEWLTLLSINGFDAETIAAYCKETYGGLWRKRFEEDLVEVLAGMGHEPGGAVELVLRDPNSLEERTLVDVPMTHENRQAIWHAANTTEQPSTQGVPNTDVAPE